MHKKILIAGIATFALALAGCSSKPTIVSGGPIHTVGPLAAATPTPSAQPKTADAAKVAAQLEVDRYAAGDFGGAWDLWAASAKTLISRDDYKKLLATCVPITGLPFTVKEARLEDGKAIVNVERASFQFTYTMEYENGAWRFEPDAESIAGYKKGVDKLIADEKASGDC